jgi:hypothetical protein
MPRRFLDRRAARCWLAGALLTAAVPGQLSTAVVAAAAAPAQDPDPAIRAAVLRAMIVLKIAPYLTPAESGGQPRKDYRIGVLGQDAVTEVAPAQLTGKKVGDATVRVVRIDLATALAGNAGEECDLLYIATAVDREVVAAVAAAHGKKPLPLVCERPGFAAMGGGVQLFVKDSCIRFEVNGDALKKQGVLAHSQLLKLSKQGPSQ